MKMTENGAGGETEGGSCQDDGPEVACVLSLVGADSVGRRWGEEQRNTM